MTILSSKQIGTLFQLGSAQLEAGDHAAAEEQFRKVLPQLPNMALAHNGLAVALHARGRDDDALGHLRLAITLEPDFPEAHYNLGVALQSLGRLNDAADSYQQAISLRPRYSEAHNNLANLLWQEGRLDEALKHARRATC